MLNLKYVAITYRTVAVFVLALAAPLALLAQATAEVLAPEAIARGAVEMVNRLELQESSAAMRDDPRWQRPRRIGLVSSRLARFDPAMTAQFKAIAGDIEVIVVEGPDDPAIATVDVVISSCEPATMRAATSMRWMHVMGVGVDSCTLQPDIDQFDFIMTNGQRIAGPAIAEHAIAMMMMLTRGLTYFHHNQIAHVWNPVLPDRRQLMDVDGRTMLVVGLGGIGTEIARRGAALGMRVIATRNSSHDGPEYVEYVGLPDELHTLAGQADVIINALPLTSDTRKLFDASFFAAAKRGAYFLSIGRGPSTDTDALVAALQSGQLAGAGLDVTDPEPLPPTHALWAMDNVVLSPHTSANTARSLVWRNLVAYENLRRYIQGDKLLSVVDLRAGY
ncbi:MAG: D-2-hydroxyacid dehydrogenase [Gammaproteobacteria bacterium]|nr:D-2-hydroxyacid dehydrogenase [Gammaproteobacteria bacterium]